MGEKDGGEGGGEGMLEFCRASARSRLAVSTLLQV